MTIESQDKLGKLIVKATALNAKQLASLLALADQVSATPGEQKGLQFTEASNIYLVKGSYYYVRINLPVLIPGYKLADPASRYYRQCLGRIDLESAKKATWQLEADLRANKKFGELKPNGHSSAAELLSLFIKRYKDRPGKHRTTATDYVKCLQDHLRPALRKVGTIHEFNSQFLYKYFDELRDAGLINSKTRLTVHRTAVRLFISDCIKNGLIDDSKVPKIPDLKEIFGGIKLDTEEENLPFEESDLAAIRANFNNFYEAILRKKPEVLYLRSMLKWYFEFLCAMGCRPGEEALGIKFSEMTKQKNAAGIFYSVKFNKGKTAETGGPREVELLPDAIEVVKEIVKLRLGKVMEIDEILKLEGYLFFDEKTQKQPRFVKTWMQYRDFLNSKNLLSRPYNLYSCRHEYINRHLDMGDSMRDIAKHCGNSVTTIEAHYEVYNIVRQKDRRAQ